MSLNKLLCITLMITLGIGANAQDKKSPEAPKDPSIERLVNPIDQLELDKLKLRLDAVNANYQATKERMTALEREAKDLTKVFLDKLLASLKISQDKLSDYDIKEATDGIVITKKVNK